MTNKLRLEDIDREVSKYNETATVDFNINGEIFTVTFYPYFDPIRINKLIERLSADFSDIVREKIEFPDHLIHPFILYHCVIEFSDFPTTKSKNIKVKMDRFIKTLKSSFFKELTDNFIQSEIEKVVDTVHEQIIVYEKFERLKERNKTKIRNMQLRSNEIIKLIEKASEDISEE